MSEKRTLELVQQEYSIACSQLGQEVYRKSVMEEDIAKADYAIEKLQRQVKALNNEGAKLMAAKSNATVELPSVTTTEEAEAASE